MDSHINICIVGCVSTGKSMLLNSLFCEDLSQCKIKRTTMVPNIYVENASDSIAIPPLHEINQMITSVNRDIIQKTERGERLTIEECRELTFQVPKLDIKISKESLFNIYDIPGLNDARTKSVYYEYLDINFVKFNIVIFMVNIESGLNTSDEMDILNFLIQQIKKITTKKIYLLVVVNKCDDMQLRVNEDGTETLELPGELNEMMNQVKDTVTTELQTNDLVDHLIGIIPLCAMDSYLYRMIRKYGDGFQLKESEIQKIGINQMGKQFNKKSSTEQYRIVSNIIKDGEFVEDMIKLSGFYQFEGMIQKFLSKNVDKKIRAQNISHQLLQLRSLFDIIHPYISAENIDMFDSSAADIREISQIDQYVASLEAIDNDMFQRYSREHITSIGNLYKSLVKKYATKSFVNMTRMIAAYEKIQKIVLQKYIPRYSIEIIHPILTQHVISSLKTICSNSVSFSMLLQIFDIVQKINEFNETTIALILENIMANSRGFETLPKETNQEIIAKLIELLRIFEIMKVPKLDLFIRFVMMNIIQDDDLERNQMRKLFYRKYHEITISELVLKRRFEIDLRNPEHMKLLMNGLPPSNDYLKSFPFDTYYLYFQHQHLPSTMALSNESLVEELKNALN